MAFKTVVSSIKVLPAKVQKDYIIGSFLTLKERVKYPLTAISFIMVFPARGKT